MQTTLAFFFILHVMAVGLFFAWRGARLTLTNSLVMTLYFAAFYVVAGLALNSLPSLILPAGSAAG